MCFLCVAAAAAVDAPAPSSGAQHAFYVANFVKPVIITVGGHPMYSFGVFVGIGVLVATMFCEIEMTLGKIDLDVAGLLCVFMFGMGIGSKSHHALSIVGAGGPLTWEVFDIKTGYSFIGSQVGAVLCVLVYIRWHRIGMLNMLDALLPCCLLGHTIGKFGCFFSGDGCYGPRADPEYVPWAMSFPNAMVPVTYPVHPTPLYEAACSFTVFSVSRWAFPLPQPKSGAGRRFGLVLVLYGIERAILENYRIHPAVQLFGGLTEYQFLAIVLLFIGLAFEANARRRAALGVDDAEEEVEPPPPPAAPATGLRRTKKKKA